LPAAALIQWAVLGVFFKNLSWTLGYVLLAKKRGQLFILTEIIAQIFIVLTTIVCYNYIGFIGLGISFSISYLFCFLLSFFVCSYFFEFSYNSKSVVVYAISFLSLLLSTFLVTKESNVFVNIILFSITLVTIVFSVYHLEKRISIVSMLKNVILKKS